MWQLCRIQWIGEAEPLALYSSVAANSEAIFENSTSSLSLWWRRWIISKPTCSAVIPDLSREQNTSMAAASSATAVDIGTDACTELTQLSIRTNVRAQKPCLLRRQNRALISCPARTASAPN